MFAKISNKKKKKFIFPTAFTILFAILLIAIVLTKVIPAGAYAKLSFNEQNNSLQILHPNGETTKLPATQESLKSIKINIGIEQFTEGKLKKPIAIPDTYEKVKQSPRGISDITESMVNGTIEAADVMVFIFVLGGLIGVVNKTGAFNAGLIALSKRSKGKEFALVFAVSILMTLGGTTCGMEEEAVAFYPILVPIFITLGFDAIVSVGAIFLAASMGTTFSTINPFSVVIASSAAGIPFTEGISYRIVGCIIGALVVVLYLYWYCKKIKANPVFSYTYEDHKDFEARFLKDSELDNNSDFTLRKKIILILFACSFPIMVWGVSTQGWWFPNMAASFLAFTIIIMFIGGESEKDSIEAFTRGASELVGVSLIIGLARGVNLVLEQGMISDTILYYASNMVTGMHGVLFAVSVMFVFFFLGLIVPSSSGLAVLSMPIIAPLADTVGIPRYIVVSAYNWGQYAMLYMAPTGLILVTLQMLGLQYGKWLKFVWPMVLFILAFSTILLSMQVMML